MKSYDTILRSLTIAALLLLAFAADAQQGEGKWLRKAEEMYRQKEYVKAIEYYEWAARSDKSAQPLLGLAKCYRSLTNYEEAASYFGEAAEIEGAPPETYFYLGQSLLSMGLEDSAKYWFQAFQEAAPRDARAFRIDRLDALLQTESPDSASFSFSKFKYNSKYSDFSAFPLGNDLYFCSTRPNETGIVHTSSSDGGSMVDIYIVEDFFLEGQGRKAARPAKSLNTIYNEGPLTASSEGKTLFITRNDAQRKSDNPYNGSLNPLRIYILDSNETGWGADQQFSLNSPDYAVGHPSLSADGSKLYFSSDKPGGFGGADIYVIDVGPNGFGAAFNLGPEINTPEDEVFPFIHASGKLFFASNGHLGFGGLDIFSSKNRRGTWTAPENLGLPVNSPKDDFAYYLSPTEDQGFFSSNRGNDPQNDDIYTFAQAIAPKFEFACAPQEENNYCFRFTEEGSLREVFASNDTVAMAYIWDLGDGTKKEGLVVEHCYEKPGEYYVQLNLIDTLSGFKFFTQVSKVVDVEEIEQLYINGKSKAFVGENIFLDALKSNLPGCSFEDLVWEVNGQVYEGPELNLEFEKAGEYTVRLAAKDEEGKGAQCAPCVTKTIQILPSP